MKWFLQRANGGDILVLRTTGSNGYNSYLYSGLGVTVNSVETIVCKQLEVRWARRANNEAPVERNLPSGQPMGLSKIIIRDILRTSVLFFDSGAEEVGFCPFLLANMHKLPYPQILICRQQHFDQSRSTI
jgi:hypothetical protein